ncbi:hypothetical protein C9427_14235 [Mesorhizobium helmanticense]|uniref:Uncharacterized protein n=1 Tax=Mesorhizobium helmanticense TaxID=1776423 RepID=A0A2T4IW02_9HYPH|nr:hypothetical protein C9427_14235 [Mesorhizobium helmanticense]
MKSSVALPRCLNGDQAAAPASLQRTSLQRTLAGTGSNRCRGAESIEVARFMRALQHGFMTGG